jgi:hypothetical protein
MLILLRSIRTSQAGRYMARKQHMLVKNAISIIKNGRTQE